MNFRIADTFTASLAKLTGGEQKQVKTTAFDLQVNPANPGMSFHKLDGVKDKNFWSVRVNKDIRLIVHKTSSDLLLCYVDHHDKAYQWAERRKLETHPKTGAAQLVEIRETVREIVVPAVTQETEQPSAQTSLFKNIPDDQLLAYGVPEEWLPDVKAVDEDGLLKLAVHLPEEAAEALLEIATGGQPEVSQSLTEGAGPFDHPDAQRRFRVMGDVDELARALDFPWDKWSVFLHPAQRTIVEKSFNGPARVAGSAGTGKTIVALHRAVHLARMNPDSRVLFTTFSETLANALRNKLRCLISHEPRIGERLEVEAIDSVGERLYKAHIGLPKVASEDQIETLLSDAAGKCESFKFSHRFVVGEWKDVVDAWQLKSWSEYRDVKRLGRKTRLPEAQRLQLWTVFEKVLGNLKKLGVVTRSEMFSELAEQLKDRKYPPFEFCVIDEAQDIGVSQLRVLATIGGCRPDSLFFAGDLGQRIFQTPFSWRSLGVDIRGRSRTLRINYRTSHQIRRQADLLLGPEVSDVDGNVEDRKGTISVFNGPSPRVITYDSAEDEIEGVASWLKSLGAEGVAPHEIGIFVRSKEQLDRAQSAVTEAGLPYKNLDEQLETINNHVAIGTMHLAKGLEFRAVVVMACDDEVIPLQERIESVSDNADLEEVYDTERHLLYVACTRARDHLLVTAAEAASEFLDDLNP